MEKISPCQDAAGYNSYCEFSSDKAQPAALAAGSPKRPWTVPVEGFVKRRKTFDLDALGWC